jgi:hypothetical protein
MRHGLGLCSNDGIKCGPVNPVSTVTAVLLTVARLIVQFMLRNL